VGSSIIHYFDDAVDIHHIFPKAWCERRTSPPPGTTQSSQDAAVRPNEPDDWRLRAIVYLPRVVKDAGIDVGAVRGHVESHFVNYELLASDDFERFFADRQQQLLARIEAAMARPPRLRWMRRLPLQKLTPRPKTRRRWPEGLFAAVAPPRTRSTSDVTHERRLRERTPPPALSRAPPDNLNQRVLRGRCTEVDWLDFGFDLTPNDTRRADQPWDSELKGLDWLRTARRCGTLGHGGGRRPLGP